MSGLDAFLIPFFCGTSLIFGLDDAIKGNCKMAMLGFGASTLMFIIWIGKFA